MKITEQINIIKMFIISYYDKFVVFVKNVFNKKQEINKQTDSQNDIHIVKVKVKKVKVKNMKTN